MNKTRKIALALLSVSAAWPGLIAQTTPPPAPAAKDTSDEELVVLTPFEINTSKDTGYQATETLAGTRIRTDLKDVASSIQVVTKEFLQDIGATDNSTLLQYMTNAEVAGTRGNFAGVGRGTSLSNSQNIATNNRIRGLVSADQTMNFFTTNIPWDSYNVDRIDIQRGPNTILFGLGSPAGIVNASTRDAVFRNTGSVEARVGSYGSVRGSIDINQSLINNILAIRIDGLNDSQKYQQSPAFKEDKRIYGAVRLDPHFFSADFNTSLKAKFEHGQINANLPRTGTVYDSITPWFGYDANKIHVDGSAISTYDLGAAAKGYSPWFALIPGTGQQTPAYIMSGTTGETYQINSGYINNAFRNNAGVKQGAGVNAVGQRYSEMYYGLASTRDWAANTFTNPYQAAMYNNTMLRDSSVFDYYNNLIDGENKREWAKWNSYNLDFSQGFWGDRVGFQLTYDSQSYQSGKWSLLGDSPTLGIDVSQVLQDGSTNPNYGRPFVTSGSGGTGSSFNIDREVIRGSLFAELRAKDFLHNDFLVKLLGRHRFNGVASQDRYNSESRNYNLYAKDNAWDAYTRQTNGLTTAFDDRAPVEIIYLGNSLAKAPTAEGAAIPAVTSNIKMKSGYSYLFDSTWTGGANYSDPWTNPTAYQQNEIFAGASTLTQASNPANYVGWSSTRYLNIMSYENGDPLYTSASKTENIVKSYAGTWQGYIWNEAIVPTIGWRYDSVKTRSVTGTRNSADKGYVRLDGSDYALPAYTSKNYYKGHSLAGGVVAHINQLLPKSWDKELPLNVSLTYNDSKNFQVTSRVDMYGNPISNPTGRTTEYGVMLSTKDDRFSLRAINYDTKIEKATVSVGGFNAGDFYGTLQQGLKFRNVFLYQLSGYTWGDRVGYVDTNVPLSSLDLAPYTYNGQPVTRGVRYFWTPAYVDAQGRAVQTAYYAGYNQALPSNDHLQTWTESLAMRDASINAWNNIQKYLVDSGFASVWKMDLQNTSSLTDRATYEASIEASGNTAANTPANSAYLPSDTTKVLAIQGGAPAGFALTSDQESKGYEFELTANVTSNWRVAFNASKTTAIQSNIGGNGYQAMVDLLDAAIAGPAGEMRQFNGDYQSGNSLRKKYADWRTTYTWLKLQESTTNSEIRKWHFNVVSNYSFTKGFLKGVGVGGAYRWADKVAIGYPVYLDSAGYAQYDITKPVYGPAEEGFDLWLSYERKLTSKLGWKVQLNIRNAMKNDGLVPVTVQPDGQTWAGVRIKPAQEWQLTNTFSF